MPARVSSQISEEQTTAVNKEQVCADQTCFAIQHAVVQFACWILSPVTEQVELWYCISVD